MDAIGPLADNGVIWVLTPKTGRSGHVEPSEIAEAALDGRALPDVQRHRERRLGGLAAGGAEGGQVPALTHTGVHHRPRHRSGTERPSGS